jgi:hypothetical protein
MMRTPRCRLTIAMLAALLCAPMLAGEVFAQAWVPAKGEGAVAVAFQSINVKKHLAGTTPVDAGPIQTNVLLTDVTYGVTDKIAVDLALPLVMSKYTGERPHPGTDIDDGTYRSTFTDVRFALRYNLTRDNAVITPYVGSVMPSHGYQFYGHAAPGQRLREVQVGVYAAKLFDRGLPGLFVSGRYGYGFVEKVLDISHNRSMADLEVGYFFTSKFRAFTMTNAGYTHGGVDFPPGGPSALPPEYFFNHDQIQKVHHLDVGGGASYSISDTLDVFGSFSKLVAGRNGHALNRGITVGASWSFSRRKNASDVTATTAPGTGLDTVTASGQAQGRREGSLVRCICQKSAS